MALVIFIVLSVLCAGAVVAMIASRNQAHNALFLVLAFSSLGGLFGLLDAPFAAVVQVLVYAGAIMVLFLFAIMLFNLRQPVPPERKRLRAILGTGLAVILFAQLILAGRRALAEGSAAAAFSGGDIAHLGRLLFSDYLYAFEITSLLILAALVGALALAGKKEGE
ncbi:MAG: NADH-quinone oxidoreductase subunit J [Candidatus Aminicenantes bacterium]|nr:MAG: NADH-quinone oxidoreductase subunit J [Candidatus Aminicenantes bacterium]